MTNTFIVSSRFDENAKCLDTKRLGKNITESMQVYKYITGQGKMQGNPHPYRMWEGYEKCLLSYICALHDEWIARFDDGRRGGKRTHKNGLEAEEIVSKTSFSDYKEPDWITDERVLSSHRSALLYKDSDWYGQWGWKEKPAIPLKTNKKTGAVSLPYFWTK
jgi:hypothetical protein